MATRIVEWKKPYTWGKAIDIDENKVISLRLREENNLIIRDEWDNEIYVDLQLPDGITPLDAFPVWITVWRVLIADDWDVNGTLVVFKTTSGDNIKLLYWDDWKLYIDNWTGLFKQIYLKGEVDALLQSLRDYVDAQLALKQDKLIAGDYIEINENVISAVIPTMSRFLSIWNASSWEPISFPASTPFLYTTGDYYLIEWVGVSDNYRPAPIEYDWSASTIPETDEVANWDVYIYDWAIWLLQSNHWKTVTFQNIAWDPYDNTNLATALNAKQNTLVNQSNIKSINNNSLLGSWDLSIAEVPSGWTNGQVLTQTSQWPAWQNATWWADIEYKTQAEYNALPSSKLTDWKHYVIYTADTPTPPTPWRQPWANTLVYYNIDDNDTTTTIYDKSWNNYDATWSSTGSYVVDSNAGRVAYFNWQYADTWAVIDFGNNFTFNVWINQTVAPSSRDYQTIFWEWASSSTLPSVWMDFRDGSTKLFGFADWTGNLIILNVSTTADLNTWMLLSMVLDSWTLTIYKNWVSLGNLANVPNPTYNISWWATFALSRWRNWDLNVFNWYIKEFIGEDKARTSQEIQDYFDQTKWDYWIS